MTTAYYHVESGAVGVPSNGLYLWLTSNFGVSTTGGSPFNYLTKWLDLSGNNNFAIPGTNAPFLVTNAVNGQPSVFNYNLSSPPPQVGTLVLPSGFSDFTGGADVFAVVNSLNSSYPGYIFDFGNGATSANESLSVTASGNSQYTVVNSSGSASSISGTGTISPTAWQFIEAEHLAGSLSYISGTIYGNAVAVTGSVEPATPVTRTLNHLFTNYNSSSTFRGGLAEILVYNRFLSESERQNVWSYLDSKYQFSQNAVPAAPLFNISTSTLGSPSQILLSAQYGTTIHYTTDGSTPTTSSPVYNGPINVAYTQTVEAIAVNGGGISSSVSQATYTLNSSTFPAPSATDPATLQINLQLPTNAIGQ